MTAKLATFEADVPVDEITAALLRDGGVIIEKLAAEALMDEVVAEIDANVSESDRVSDAALWEGNRTIGQLCAVSPMFADHLVAHPKLLDIADAVLLPFAPYGPSAQSAATGGDYEAWLHESGLVSIAENQGGQTQLIVNEKDPKRGPTCHHYTVGVTALLQKSGGGAGSASQPLHREKLIYQPFFGRMSNVPDFILSVMWAGTEFTKDNGATRLAPGSQDWPEERIAEEHEVVQAIMPKGSVALWLTRTLHGAGTSTVMEGRVGLTLSYIADWARQEENQYIAVPPEAAQRLSLTARQLLGYKASPSLGWVKGRDADDLTTAGKSGQI